MTLTSHRALGLRGVKYTFITAIESCVDVAQHICAAEGWGPPDDNADALALLGRHGVLDPALAGRMRQAVGFRNSSCTSTRASTTRSCCNGLPTPLTLTSSVAPSSSG